MRHVLLIAALIGAGLSGTIQAQSIIQNFNANFPDTSAVTPGSVTVWLTDHDENVNFIVENLEVPGLASFLGRPKADARTGGANSNQDIGDINITYSAAGTDTPVVYSVNDVGTNPQVLSNNTAPALATDGDGVPYVIDGVFDGLEATLMARVGYTGEAGTGANIAWDTSDEAPAAWDSMLIQFPVRISGEGGAPGGAGNDLADGFGFSYVNTEVDGDAGAFYTSGEEPSASGIGIGVDIWDNGGEGENSVSVHWNGQLLSSIDVKAGTQPNGDPFVWAYEDAPLESAEPLLVSVNVLAGQGTLGAPTRVGGAEYIAAATRNPATQGLDVRQDGDAVGEVDAYFRLTEEINGQGNYLAFDAVSGAGSRPVFGARTGGANEFADIDSVKVDYGPGTVTAEFDFRIGKAAGGDPADGLAFVLARTDVHGTTGEVSQAVDQAETTGVDWGVAEDPVLAGSLGIGFKTFQDNELRIRYDGQEVLTDAPPENFAEGWVDGEWHNAIVTVQDQGDDAFVTILLDEAVVYSDVITGAAGLGLDINANPFAPCDFDQNGVCDVADIDSLMEGIGGNDASLDMNGDGTVDNADRDQWLVDAGNKEIGTPFSRGDADLDGDVDALDLNAVGVNWQRQDATSWAQADFDRDGDVDAEDLNEVGIFWQTGVAAGAESVPEPNGAVLAVAGALGLLSLRRRRNR